MTCEPDNAVGRPEIQAFVGALHGAQADRGIFITTSRFTPEAPRTHTGWQRESWVSARLTGRRSCAEPPTEAVAARPRSAARSCRGSGPGDHSRIPHASASSSRLSAGAPSSGPGSAWTRLLATSRPTSRRSRFSSAFRASSSARGTLIVSDASALTRSSPRLGDLNPSLDRGARGAEDVGHRARRSR